MNILDVLHADHTVVTNLLAEAGQAKSASQVGQLFESIRRELEVHIRAEEGIFYPEVERIGPEAAGAIATAIAQHGDAVILIGELTKLKPGAEDFKAKLKELETAVKKHIEHEEGTIFRLVRERFGKVLDDLGERVRRREDALKAGGQIAGSE
jgi:hemerythrin-like domain-containing protein